MKKEWKYDTISTEFVITSAEASMAVEQNVLNQRAQDVENGTYKKKKSSSSSSSSDDGNSKKMTQSQTVKKSVAKRPPPPPPGKKKEQVRCDYDYVAQEEGELSFREGDIITVLKKEGDWWYGELRGKEGLFPYNYASPI